ncbi:hypothetical protein D3C73_1177740 [compost metagenome]
MVADVGQQGLGAKRCGETVGHVTGDADGVLGGESAFGDAQCVELGRLGMAVLILVDAVQIGLHGDEGWRLLIEVGQVGFGPFANAQGAHQLVGVEQFWPQHFGQFTAGEAAQHFHLEQSVLGVHVAEGAIQVGFVVGANVRDAALVVTHGDRALQVLQLNHALARRLFAVDVATNTHGEDDDQHDERNQETFHSDSLFLL